MYAQLGRQAGQVAVLIDGHDVRPNPTALDAALKVHRHRPGLLLLDSYELLLPLDDWLREELLPGLPAGTLVVFQADAKEFKKLASYKVASGGTYAYPIVSGNRIFIKDSDSLTMWTIE